VAGTVSNAGVRVMSTWLLNTCSCGLVGILVNGALKLLQELVNVQQVALSPEVGKRQRVWVVHWWMRGLSNHGTALAVVTHAAALVATLATTENWKLYTLEAHEPLADVVVSVWVNSTALGIAEEFVERIISGTLPDFIVVVQLLALVDGIVNRTIGRVLGWAAVETSGSASRMLLAIGTVRTKGAIRILISTCCSGKCLQVSDNCIPLLETERKGLMKSKVWGCEETAYVCHSEDTLQLRVARHG